MSEDYGRSTCELPIAGGECALPYGHIGDHERGRISEPDCHPECGPIIARQDGDHAHENEDGVCWHGDDDIGSFDDCPECEGTGCERIGRDHEGECYCEDCGGTGKIEIEEISE